MPSNPFNSLPRPGSGDPPGSWPGQPQAALRSHGDLIAYLPYLIGYHPAESHVVFFAARSRTLLGTAVVDVRDSDVPLVARLWDAVTSRLLDPAIDPAIGPVRAAGPGHLSQPVVIVISYGSPLADAVARALKDLGPAELTAVLRVHESRWWCLGCKPGGLACHHDPAHDPARDGTGDGAGRGLPVDPAGSLVIQAVIGGVSPRAGQDDITGLLRPGPPDLIAAVTAQLPARGEPDDSQTAAGSSGDAAAGQATDGNVSPTSGFEPIPWRDGLAQLQAALAARQTGDPLTEPVMPAGFTPDAALRATPEAITGAARLLRALEDVIVRDQSACWTSPAAGQLWRDLIRYAPPGWTAPVATLLGLHAAVNNDPALARFALQHALDERPGYRLAQLMSRVLTQGVDPTRLLDVLAQGAALTAAAAASDGD